MRRRFLPRGLVSKMRRFEGGGRADACRMMLVSSAPTLSHPCTDATVEARDEGDPSGCVNERAGSKG